MPTVAVNRERLFALLGRQFTDSEFEDLCFEYGIELDDVTTEREIHAKQGINAAQFSDDIVYKIEIPANRYDLLCIEGLVLNLRVFLGLEARLPQYTVTQPQSMLTIRQSADTLAVRPFIVGAVLRDFAFTEANYRSFIDLQDKLHQNIGRRRTLVAIGTHDLDTLKPPFTYEALPQSAIEFVPLNEKQKFSVDKLFAHYKINHSHLAQYLSITESAPNHPVIYDSQRTVLSLPPIINGDHSKITLQTKNILIECTGTDATKLVVALQTIIAMFSQYCAQRFTVEPVQIIDSYGKSTVTPVFDTPVFANIGVQYINDSVGINLSANEMAKLLNRMSLTSVSKDSGATIDVTVPITRTDILHPCDIVEDVAIGYGYNNITKTIPKTYTPGKQFPINSLTDQLREVVAQCGWMEVLTWALVSSNDNYNSMNRAVDSSAIQISNPKTAEFEQVRLSLVPGLLRALSSNKGQINLPVKLFEAGDVAMIDTSTDTGARNQRMLAALYCGVTSGFEFIHGLVDRIMHQNRFTFRHDYNDSQWQSLTELERRKVYELRPSEHNQYLPLRQADILVNDTVIGSFGVVHPKVLAAFEIEFPCAALEIDVQKAFVDQNGVSKESLAANKERPIHEHVHGEGRSIIH